MQKYLSAVRVKAPLSHFQQNTNRRNIVFHQNNQNTYVLRFNLVFILIKSGHFYSTKKSGGKKALNYFI